MKGEIYPKNDNTCSTQLKIRLYHSIISYKKKKNPLKVPEPSVMEQVRHICPRLLLRFSSSGSDPVLSANMTLTHFPAFPPLWLVSICSHSARCWRWWWAGKVEKANSWWPFVKSLLHVFSYREQKCVRFNNKSRLTSFFSPLPVAAVSIDTHRLTIQSIVASNVNLTIYISESGVDSRMWLAPCDAPISKI